MPIIVRCAHCQAKAKIKDDLQGRSVKCPTCGQVFRAVVEATAVQAAPPPVQPAPEPEPRRPLRPVGPSRPLADYDAEKKSSQSARREKGSKGNPRNQVFGFIGVLLGGGILVFSLLRGGPQGSGAYAGGQFVGMGLGGLLFVVGLVTLISEATKSGRKKPKARPSSDYREEDSDTTVSSTGLRSASRRPTPFRGHHEEPWEEDAPYFETERQPPLPASLSSKVWGILVVAGEFIFLVLTGVQIFFYLALMEKLRRGVTLKFTHNF